MNVYSGLSRVEQRREAALGLGGGPVEPAWLGPAVWGFVALGIIVRLVRYLVDYPIWHDEAFLAASLWDRSPTALLLPLEYGQIAPWLFLVAERGVVLLLGYSELTLRLLPTISSVLSVPCLALVAGSILGRKPQLLAAAIFAVSIYPVRHGAEVKPYALDLLVSLILLAVAVRLLRDSRSSAGWWILAVLAPLAVWASYPSVFVAGGITLALGLPAIRSDRRAVRLGFLTFNLVLLASFAASYVLFTSAQASAMLDQYRNGCWANSFPPTDRPWTLPLWFLDVHSGTMMAYPAGDRHGGSLATLACFVIGCIALYRTGRRRLLALLLSPFLLGLIAACLGKYPYGGAPRIMLYLAPAICLTAGLGLSRLLDRLRRPLSRRFALPCVLAGAALLGVGLIVRDLARPYRVPEDVRTREFARWFWTGPAGSGEGVCLKSDLGLSFRSDLWSVGMSAVYLFHQRMYSERHRHGRPPAFDPSCYSSDRPLRLVSFDDWPEGVPAFDSWLAALMRDFEPRRRDTYLIQPGKPGEAWLRDAYVVLELVPRVEARSLARRPSVSPSPRRL